MMPRGASTSLIVAKMSTPESQIILFKMYKQINELIDKIKDNKFALPDCPIKLARPERRIHNNQACNRSIYWVSRHQGGLIEGLLNPFVPTVAFNICCPREQEIKAAKNKSKHLNANRFKDFLPFSTITSLKHT